MLHCKRNYKLVFGWVGTQFCFRLCEHLPTLLFSSPSAMKMPGSDGSCGCQPPSSRWRRCHDSWVWTAKRIRDAHSRILFSRNAFRFVLKKGVVQQVGQSEQEVDSSHHCVSLLLTCLLILLIYFSEKMNFSWCQLLSRKHTLLDSGSVEKREDQCTVKNVSLRTKAPSVWQIKSYLWIKNLKISHLRFFSHPPVISTCVLLILRQSSSHFCTCHSS